MGEVRKRVKLSLTKSSWGSDHTALVYNDRDAAQSWFGGFEHQEAAQLHDEFKGLRAGHGVPTSLLVMILEVPSGGAPRQHGDRLAILQHELAQAITSLPSRAEQMLLIKHSVSDGPVCRVLRDPYF